MRITRAKFKESEVSEDKYQFIYYSADEDGSEYQPRILTYINGKVPIWEDYDDETVHSYYFKASELDSVAKRLQDDYNYNHCSEDSVDTIISRSDGEGVSLEDYLKYGSWQAAYDAEDPSLYKESVRVPKKLKEHCFKKQHFSPKDKPMEILNVGYFVKACESRGHKALLTINGSEGSAWHTTFDSYKDWNDFKETVNQYASITEVWAYEVDEYGAEGEDFKPMRESVEKNKKVDLGEMIMVSRQFKKILDLIESNYGLKIKLVNNFVTETERGEQYALIGEDGFPSDKRFAVTYEYSDTFSEDDKCYIVRCKAFVEGSKFNIYGFFKGDDYDINLPIYENKPLNFDYFYTHFIKKFVLPLNGKKKDFNYSDIEVEETRLSDKEMLELGYEMLEYAYEEVWGPSKSFVEISGEIGGYPKVIRVYRNGKATER